MDHNDRIGWDWIGWMAVTDEIEWVSVRVEYAADSSLFPVVEISRMEPFPYPDLDFSMEPLDPDVPDWPPFPGFPHDGSLCLCILSFVRDRLGFL